MQNGDHKGKTDKFFIKEGIQMVLLAYSLGKISGIWINLKDGSLMHYFSNNVNSSLDIKKIGQHSSQDLK